MLLRIQHNQVCLIPWARCSDGGCLRQIKVTAMRTYYSSSAFLGMYSVFTRLVVCGGGCDGTYRQSDEKRRL